VVCPNCGSDRFGDEYNDYSVAESCPACGFKRVYGPNGWVTARPGKSQAEKRVGQ
jgi:RNA polymerase subunit RPABC4/transcription elongation factor Spt4